MAATLPLRPAAAQTSPLRLVVVQEQHTLECFLPGPTMLLLGGWQSALQDGRSTAASGYRRLVDAIADEEPTWEDAEWQ